MITIEDLGLSAQDLITEEEVARTAYDIWMKEGCPEGQAERHWAEAKEIVAESACVFIAQAFFHWNASRDGYVRQILPTIPMNEKTMNDVIDAFGVSS